MKSIAKRVIPFQYGQTVSDVPSMVAQWDYEKNVGVDINVLSVTSKTPQYHWICSKCGFAWEASVEARLYSDGKCPCCEQNRVIVPGINDLRTKYPAAEMIFDHSTNAENGIYIDQLPATQSKIDIAWNCKKCGHKWVSSLRVMIPSGFKCRCCETNRVIVKGINDALTVVPGLADYYDFEKNEGYDIFSKGVSCIDKVFWKCPTCGRSWKSSIASRITGTKGNYCIVPCPHYNTEKRSATNIQFVAQVPNIYQFWDHSKNTLDPSCTPINSPELAFWKCSKCEHEWKAAISSREKSTHKCPQCELNLKTRRGVSDLFTVLPAAKDDYDFEKNIGIDIYNLSPRSSTMVWWKCKKCGHEWKSKISTRVHGTKGNYSLSNCRQCYHEKRRQCGPKVAEFPHLIKFWDYVHNKELGLDPNLTSANSEQQAYWKCKKCGYSWSSSILNRKKSKSNKCPCCDSNLRTQTGVNDVFTVVPELKRIYDFKLNADTNISSEGVGSSVVVNFACPSCHRTWSAPISHAIRKQPDGTYRVIGCPTCDNRKYRKVSFSEQYPDLSKLFNEEKNGCKFDEVRSDNTTKFWWTCETCGEFFQSRLYAMIASQKTNTKGCPFCSRTRVRPGESFADVHPELMDEYSPDNQVDPYQVYPSSKKYTDWRCRNNPAHQWKTSFYQRHIGSGKCPICNRTRPYAGVNTFSDVYPEYVDLWSPANEKAPHEVFADSTVWYKWRCPECSEEYSAQIQNVVSGKKSCPYCRDRKVLGGVNSFADVYPEVAKQWSAKNAKAAGDVLHSIKMDVLWNCDICGGEYLAPANEMADGTYTCPYCDNRRLLPGFNSLANRYPDIAKHWSSNNEKTADQVLSDVTVLGIWTCPDCHGEYNAYINEVVSGEYTCPYCNNRKVLPGFNSLAVRKPDLLNEWSYLNNYLLADPDHILPSSTVPVWWQCPSDEKHVYPMSPASRLLYQKRKREPCLYCKGRRRKKRHFV